MIDDLTYRILELSYRHKLSHIGSCLTAAPILDEIYTQRRPDEACILSAGHAGLALYCVLEKHCGKDAEDLLKRHGVHPTKNEADGIHCSTGSLGQGISVAVGRALADRSKRVWVYITDGECAEGVVYESLSFAGRAKLDNLKVHVGWNGFSAYQESYLKQLSALRKLFPLEVTYGEELEIPFLQGLAAHYHTMSEQDWVWVEANRPQSGPASSENER